MKRAYLTREQIQERFKAIFHVAMPVEGYGYQLHIRTCYISPFLSSIHPNRSAF